MFLLLGHNVFNTYYDIIICHLCLVNLKQSIVKTLKVRPNLGAYKQYYIFKVKYVRIYAEY